jgi:hypothetical protein
MARSQQGDWKGTSPCPTSPLPNDSASKKDCNKDYSKDRHKRQEGRQEGRQEEAVVFLQRQLTHRFGRLPDAVCARLTSASIEQLETWILNVLDAESLDDFFDRC